MIIKKAIVSKQSKTKSFPMVHKNPKPNKSKINPNHQMTLTPQIITKIHFSRRRKAKTSTLMERENPKVTTLSQTATKAKNPCL